MLSSHTCYNVGEPQRHYVKQKKSHLKDYILYDLLYMKCRE